MSEENQTQENQDGKESNRTFTQSDFDKMIAKKEKEISERFKDYDTLKNKAETFEKMQAEQEQAKLSEVEKAQKRTLELEQRLAQIEAEKNSLAKQTLKLSVLSDAKYSILPDPYKKVIEGDDETAIRESAEKTLKDFEETLKKLGIKQGSSGMPMDNKQQPPVTKLDPIAEAFRKKFAVK